MPDPILMRRAPAPVGAPYPYMLIPSDTRSAEALSKFAIGEDVAVTVKRGRSLPQHRLFWSCLEYVAKATEWQYPERLLVALKVRLGRYDLLKMPSGKVVPVPQSISFSEMSQDDFQAFFEQCMGLITTEVLPGYDPEVLIREAGAA